MRLSLLPLLLFVGLFFRTLEANVAKKANCRLKFERSFQSGDKQSSYKDVFTKSKENCDKLSEKGDFIDNIRTDLIKVGPENPFNCRVSIFRERSPNHLKSSEYLEYFVAVQNIAECRRKGLEKPAAK